MTPSPPALAGTTSARWQDEQREGSIGHPCLNAEALVRLARSSPEIAALDIGQSRLSRIVRAFVVEHRDRPRNPGYHLIPWVLSYADPTARTAVRNVDRERGW